ncbi:hypothetical protein OIO90_005750 [Microbotryomycetes sp. JL221]|nr:hypothetical protein OIO90_005750 [Microbotryomycetes sp. JL221]
MATPNERLLYAAKTDLVELAQDVLSLAPNDFDVNFRDGLGNTALHYAASSPSPDVLDLLLDFDATDVDLQNRLEGATPMHLAVKLQNEAARQGVIQMLLDAGADPAIKDRHDNKVGDYLNPDNETDQAIEAAIKAALAEAAFGGIDSADIANEDDDGEGGSESD